MINYGIDVMLQHVQTEVKGIIYVYVEDCAAPLRGGVFMHNQSFVVISSMHVALKLETRAELGAIVTFLFIIM